MKIGLGQTRREQKHDMLLTFMVNAGASKKQTRVNRNKPRFLKTILSLFM